MRTGDLNATILSQYANSPAIMALIRGMNKMIDPAADIEKFLREVWDISTATTWGLDNWGRILGISRLLEIQGDDPTFGFMGSTLQPFGRGTFTRPGATSIYSLADEAYRALLMLKAAANVSNCSVPSLNSIIQNMLAGRGPCYVLEVGAMQIRYVFEFILTPYERALMRNQNVPPKPAGVGYEVLEVDIPNTFGFSGSGLQPFNNAPFNGGPVHAY